MHPSIKDAIGLLDAVALPEIQRLLLGAPYDSLHPAIGFGGTGVDEVMRYPSFL